MTGSELRPGLWRQAACFVIPSFILSRLLLLAVAYLGFNLFPRYVDVATWETHGSDHQLVLPGPLCQTHVPTAADLEKFDSGFYLQIASNGYDRFRMAEPHRAANWPFFPLYPLLVRALHLVVPLTWQATALLASNLCGILALLVLYRVVLHLAAGRAAVARRTILLVLCFPASMYLSLMYTESLFLLLSALTWYLVIRKHRYAAVACAALSTVTRVPGIVNVLLVAMVWLHDAGWNPFRVPLRSWVALALCGVPLLVFFSYMHHLTGDFLAVFHELSVNWGRDVSMPGRAWFSWPVHPTFIEPGGWDFALVSFCCMTLVLAVYGWLGARNVRTREPMALELLVYGLALVVIPLLSASNSMISLVRYCMMSFPFLVLLARYPARHPVVHHALLLLFTSVQCIYTIGFINTYYFVV